MAQRYTDKKLDPNQPIQELLDLTPGVSMKDANKARIEALRKMLGRQTVPGDQYQGDMQATQRDYNTMHNATTDASVEDFMNKFGLEAASRTSPKIDPNYTPMPRPRTPWMNTGVMGEHPDDIPPDVTLRSGDEQRIREQAKGYREEGSSDEDLMNKLFEHKYGKGDRSPI